MITDKELISRFQALKQVKPRENWVIFAKSQIFDLSAKTESNTFKSKAVNKPSYRDILANIFRISFQRKYAYAIAVFLFVIVGIAGVMQFNLLNFSGAGVDTIQPAALSEIKHNVEEFKAKSKSLSEIAKHNIEDVSLAVKEVEKAAKEITRAIQKDPELAKEIALEINNNKTYLQIEGAEGLKETSEVLYKTIVEQMVKDLGNTTLTESQQDSFDIIKGLYEQGDYTSALESILLLSVAISGEK